MKKHSRENHHDNLGEDVRSLLAATAHIAEESVVQARKRVSAAFDHGKEFCVVLRDKAVEGAEVADHTVRSHPYETIGVAMGLGALIGFVLARRN